MSTELEVIDAESQELVHAAPPTVSLFHTDDPALVIERAAATAEALSQVLKKQRLYMRIGKRDHVLLEGWTLLGSMLGVYPNCVWTRPLDNGWEARVEARTLAGAIVGAAEAECLRSEKTWATRDDYALRSMAQTRATSKALRLPLGFVISLAGFDPTPAEEMPTDSGAGSTVSHGRENPSDSLETGAGSKPAPEPFAGVSDGGRGTLPPGGSPASPAKIAHITALVKDAASMRKTAQKAVKDALRNDGYDLDHLSDVQADEVIGKLERWCNALRAQRQMA